MSMDAPTTDTRTGTETVTDPGSGAPVAWIAADWGTSRLRLWPLDAKGNAGDERRSDRGMGRLGPADYEPELLGLITDLLAPDRVTDVLICGMAGARQGWCEAAYQSVPTAPAGGTPVTVPTVDPRIRVRILPGLSQAEPPNVMRGEETQIAGALSERPGFDGTLCLPGTHTKWVRVRDGRVLAFDTTMSGEIFGLLVEQSVLRHSMGGDLDMLYEWHDRSFREALAEDPADLPRTLFGIRARSLMEPLDPGIARARLSGLLLGAELAATRSHWDGLPVLVIGRPDVSARYVTGLSRLGCAADSLDGSQMALTGLKAAYASLTAVD